LFISFSRRLGLLHHQGPLCFLLSLPQNLGADSHPLPCNLLLQHLVHRLCQLEVHRLQLPRLQHLWLPILLLLNLPVIHRCILPARCRCSIHDNAVADEPGCDTDEIMHMFAASGVYIEMSPWPPPFTMMGRQGYDAALKITLSRGQLKCKNGRMIRTYLSWIQPVTPSFKAKIRCSSYVCLGSSCHTYDQNVSTENQCL
jgi:hypothetical protein